MRVLTCNLHEAKEKDTEALGRLISETNPAIVALQNWHARYQKPIFADEPWHSRPEGQLYVASRYPITDVELFRHPSITQAAAAARYELQTPIGASSYSGTGQGRRELSQTHRRAGASQRPCGRGRTRSSDQYSWSEILIFRWRASFIVNSGTTTPTHSPRPVSGGGSRFVRDIRVYASITFLAVQAGAAGAAG
jgi:hypothetical protein